MRHLSLQPAVLRDASYVMANLRPEDELEVLCQVPDDVKRHELAYNLIMGSDAYTVRVDRDPIALFGTSPMTVNCLSVWALGTAAVWRAVPLINRFMLFDHLPARMAEGFNCMEARSHVEHRSAHRWLEAMGGKVLGEPFEFGKAREKFLLFRWTSDVFQEIVKARNRGL